MNRRTFVRALTVGSLAASAPLHAEASPAALAAATSAGGRRATQMAGTVDHDGWIVTSGDRARLRARAVAAQGRLGGALQ